jgi:parallel beta-helix repeat protein
VVLTVTLAMAMLVPGSAPLVAADSPECGSTVTSSVTLTGDLDCSETSGGPALTIGADGVTLDLGGHSLVGSDDEGSGQGVIDNPGFDDVRVTNGTIIASDLIAVRYAGTSGGVVSELTGRTVNTAFVAAENTTGLVVEDITNGITDNGAAVFVVDSSNATVRRVVGNDGVVVHWSANSVVTDSVIGRNDVAGVRLFASINVLVVGNTINGSGIIVWEGRGNVVRNNTASRAGWPNITVGQGAADTTVEGNELWGGQGPGLYVDPTTTNTLLIDNIAHDQQIVPCCSFDPGDGIRVESASTTLAGNLAYSNSGWGIRAVPGVTDGGGNRAYGNDAGQCLNVSCTTTPPCTVRGTAGHDLLAGTPGDDVICALEGDDTILGSAGDDTFVGGPGRDTVSFVSSGAAIFADLGARTIRGQGADTTKSVENIVGSAYADELAGDRVANRMEGAGGHDVVWGFDGNDTIRGGSGDDALYGMDGADTLRGQAGRDALVGDRGSDFCDGGADLDTAEACEIVNSVP